MRKYASSLICRIVERPMDLRRAKVYIFCIIVPLLLSGCSSTGQYVATPALTEVTVDQIEEDIQSGDPFRALQHISLLEKGEVPVPASTLEALQEDAAQILVSLFEDAISNKDFRTARSLFLSSRLVFGKNQYAEWTAEKLIQAEAKQLLARGEAVPALITLANAGAIAGLDSGDVELFQTAAGELGYGSLFVALSNLTESSGEADYALSPPKTSSMVSGTVTILVNKGIRLERGVGYPDSVIGSGFFIDPRGYILTNYHVIESEVNPEYEGFSRLYIRPAGSEHDRIPARVVGWDSALDVALLKTEIRADFHFPIVLDISYSPGDRIMAIGSPGGLHNTVTSGIVSAVGRRFLPLGNAVQVDVPVNPGNSGGPLIDEYGRLIGIVFAGIEQFEGINFAIPADWIAEVVPELYLGGMVDHSWLGLAAEETRRGLEVSFVMPDEPAYHAGIMAGDLITVVNGDASQTIEEIQRTLLQLEANTLVSVRWTRDGEPSEGIVSLGSRPEFPMDVALKRDIYTRIIPVLFGMTVEKTGNYFWDSSYVVSRIFPGGLADETGLSVNDPLKIMQWDVDEENRVAYMQIVIKKRKAGFIERAIQLVAHLDVNNFL